MAVIKIPEGDEDDVYSLGFDKSLNRSIQTDSNSAVYDSIEDRIAGASISLGGMIAGTGDTMIAIDPAKGLWLGGEKFDDAPFRVNMQGNMRASSATISGSISGVSLDIPDTVTANSFHVDVNGNMWLGATTFGAAPGKVSNTGAATFSSMTITGGAISGTPISGIPNDTSTDISLLEKTHTMVFSVTDSNTIAWTSGTVTLSNGRTFSISSGNTGNMAALSYLYIDPAVSTTVMQVTTTAATAMGANKILIGTAQNHTVTAHFIPYGPGQPLIDGSNIGALSIVAGNIAATTITAGKMSVTELSAIVADLGSITAGDIVLPSGGFIRSGQTAYATGTGFYLGNDSGTPKFSIGSSTFYMRWTGSALETNFKKPIVRVYTANDTWSFPTGLGYVCVECIGGGGGGGGTTTLNTGAGGGGAGGYVRVFIEASELNSTETITIGAGGTAGAGTGGTGGTGGTTSFDSRVQATGGAGGTESTAGGAGGIGQDGDVTADIKAAGGAGGPPHTTAAIGGAGGSGIYGGGGAGIATDSAGNAGTGFGGGGSGGASGGSDRAGGAGSGGLIIVTEYYM